MRNVGYEDDYYDIIKRMTKDDLDNTAHELDELYTNSTNTFTKALVAAVLLHVDNEINTRAFILKKRMQDLVSELIKPCP